MKKISLLFIILSLLIFDLNAQSSYSNGFVDGYKKGYCYLDVGCVPPVTPVIPVLRIGEKDTYQDGYNRGFDLGLDDKKKTTKSYTNERPTQDNKPMTESGRYPQPARYNPQDTYVSPDWDLLFQAAMAKREFQRQKVLANMQQTVNQYNSFHKYPQTIENGWHNVVIMDNYSYCGNDKVFVNDNKITKYIYQDCFEMDLIFSGNISQGHGIIKIRSLSTSKESGYMDVFFIEAISKPSSHANPPASGSISFFTDLKRSKNVRLWVNGEYYGYFKKYFSYGSGYPNCGGDGTITIPGEPGTYSYKAKSGLRVWRGEINIKPGKCYLQGIMKK